MTFLRYSLLRLLLLLGCLLVLWLVGVRDPLLLIVLTAVVSVVLSYFVLRGPREAMTAQLAERVAGRARRPGGADDVDAAAEDAEIASAEIGSAERQPDPQEHPEGELGAAGVAEHRDEREPGGPTADGAQGRPQHDG